MQKLFNAWKKEDQDAAVIQLLKYAIGVLLLLCLGLMMGWISAPSRLTVYVPPNLSSGIVLKHNQIPKTTLYSFVYEVWQEINYWSQNGQQDYATNLSAYSAYLTKAFQSQLQQDEADLKAAGQLDRERTLQPVDNAGYDDANVKQLDANTWEVDLHMRLTETKNNQIVKDVEILYPLKVVRANISQKYNPFGLAIAGFVSDPQRLKTYV